MVFTKTQLAQALISALGLKKESEHCLQEFEAANDDNEGTSTYLCGLYEGHEGKHAWRADLPGGPKET